MQLDTKVSVAVLGGKGLLGGDLVSCLSGTWEVCSVDLENYDEMKSKKIKFDLIINANGNPRRFWANEHPFEDFLASTVSVYKSIVDFAFKKYIYISSPDAYENPAHPATTLEAAPGGTEKLSPYGFHKRLSEELVKRYADDFLILRSAALLGTRLSKGIVYDILQGSELYATVDSRVQHITTAAVADIIKTLCEKNIGREVFNVGGIGTVTPADIAAAAGKPVRVREDAKLQEYEMNTEKVRSVYGALKTSEEYVRMFLAARR